MLVESIKNRWASQGGYREFLVIAIPLIMSTSSLAVQELVDRMFLAWYSPISVAAAMPAGILHFGITGLFFGTAGYTGTFVAQYYGAQRFERVGPALWQGIYFALIGAAIIACLIPYAGEIFSFIGHEEIIQEQEASYFRILCMGTFPLISSAVLSGYFSGRGKAWPVMYVNVIGTFINIILDYLLIFGKFGFPELGISGAAIATVCSISSTVLIFACMTLLSKSATVYNTRRGWRFDRGLFKRLLRYGFPSGVQFLLEISGFSIFILLIGRLGMESLAATNIAFNINTMAFFPMIGSGVAISVLVGQYIGAEKPQIAQKCVYSSYHLTFTYMVCFASFFIFFPHIFAYIFTAGSGDKEVMNHILSLTIVLLRFVAFYSLFDAANIIFSCAIRGAGDTLFTMIVSGIATLFLVTATSLAVFVFEAGLIICWAIATTYICSMSGIFFLRFRCGKWKKMRVIEKSAIEI